jgi:hypothetical protein
MKTLKLENVDLHAADPHQKSFNTKRYYERIYGAESCSMTFVESFDLSLLEYCLDNFVFVYHSGFNMSLDGLKRKINKKNIFNYINIKNKPNFYFFNDDYIFVLNVMDKEDRETYHHGDDDTSFLYPDITSSKDDVDDNDKKINSINSKITVTVYYPNYKFLSNLSEKFLFLEKFKIKYNKRDFVSVLMKDVYGEYDFIPLDIKVPKFDVELNYGKKFVPIYEKTIDRLKNRNKGLYMFHGESGTGKSSFIKHLTTVVDKEFIFVPTSFIEKFVSDPEIFSILIKRKRCVLILEDAEKILISRERQDNEYISAILNLSDGILSDMLEASIIITYNCDDTKIDKALKRKGRTMVDYKFDKLCIEDSKKLAKSLKINSKKIDSIQEPMSLSEIYNINDDNRFYDDEEKDNRIVGFGK